MTLFFATLACLIGVGISFRFFFQSFDLISGDLGDARFNSIVLEHTWLWLKGVHPSLFDLPMFYPHPNVYAYSDFLFGSAPLYWLARALGFDVLHSFQTWLISGVVLSFFCFFLLLRKAFEVRPFLAIAGAYLFAFSVVRMTHLEHAQLSSSFWVILSAYGILKLARKPESRSAWIYFVFGATLQLLTSFYFFWYWIWSLAVIFAYFWIQHERRDRLKAWFRKLNIRFGFGVVAVCVATAFPFLWHYLMAAKEMGIRGWGSISYSLPRIYSWIALPADHWEFRWLPFQDWIRSLPMLHEHYLSFGLLSWCVFLWALRKTYRDRAHRWLSIPVIVMFVLTFSIGRISPWALMTYLFPAGGAIRAVGRIQIFMLLFWIPILVLSLKNKRYAGLLLCILFAENYYSSTQVFSAKAESRRIERLENHLPLECRILAYLPNPTEPLYAEQLDAVRAAFNTGRFTVNGYSGNQPKGYEIEQWAHSLASRNEAVCQVDGGRLNDGTSREAK